MGQSGGSFDRLFLRWAHSHHEVDSTRLGHRSVNVQQPFADVCRSVVMQTVDIWLAHHMLTAYIRLSLSPSGEAPVETFEWTVDHYLARQEARCPVCEFRILIGEKVDREGEVVSHARCRIGAPVEATDATRPECGLSR